MTDKELAAIRARWAAAASGPWYDTDLPDGTLRVSFLPLVGAREVPDRAPADWPAFAVCVIFPGSMEDYEGEDLRTARAIAAPPVDVATLLGEVDRLRGAILLALSHCVYCCRGECHAEAHTWLRQAGDFTKQQIMAESDRRRAP